MASSDLSRLANRLGVTASYVGYDGKPAGASDDALRAVLAALGYPARDDDDASRLHDDVDAAFWSAGGPPVAVAWDGTLDLPLRVPADHDGDVAIELDFEDGRGTSFGAQLFDLEPAGHAWPGGRVHCLRRVRVAGIPPGYHRARWRVTLRQARGARSIRGDALVIAAPSRAWGGPGERPRGWGVFAPIHAARDAMSGGAGDLRTLRAIAAVVGARGGRHVATLPLLAAFLDDNRCEPSPYAPASRLAWNELYLDLASAPGIEAAPRARAALDAAVAERERLYREPLVDYREQYRWRRRVIDELAASAWAAPALRDELERFAATGHARGYAAFRAVHERAATADVHIYAQWAMDRQLAAFAADGAGLYLDLPVGVACESYDVKAFGDQFALGAGVGAPPDALFVGGQDWGLPPLHPERARAAGWGYAIDVIRHHMRHAAMLRIDHVMGLHRLYWVPTGFAATDGVYVRYASDELWAIVCLESHRNRCAVVGEDLGTVPPDVPAAMRAHAVSGLWVRQFAMPEPATGVDPEPAGDAVACLNTHDTPTFAGWWAGNDIDIMLEIGLVTSDAAVAAHAARAATRDACARIAGTDDPAAIVAALYRRMAAGPAHDVLVTLEDAWLESRPQNVPGTGPERPNWRRPFSRSVGDAVADPAVIRILDDVAAGFDILRS